MPPKGVFTLARLQAFGAAAAESARARLANEGGHSCDELTCEYRGVATDEGHDINEIPTNRATIAYEWHASVGGNLEHKLVKVRCGHASDQGVPFPDGWYRRRLETLLGSSKFNLNLKIVKLAAFNFEH